MPGVTPSGPSDAGQPQLVPAAPRLISSQVVLPDVVDVHATGAGLETEGERIAQAVRPDRLRKPGLRAVERVVGRNRAVVVETQDLAEDRSEVLRVGGRAVLADRRIELAVRTEAERAAVVDEGGRQGRRSTIAVSAPVDTSPVATRRLMRLCAVRRGRRVVNLYVAVARAVGMEGQADETAFASVVDLELVEGRRKQRAVLDHAKEAGFLGDKMRPSGACAKAAAWPMPVIHVVVPREARRQARSPPRRSR